MGLNSRNIECARDLFPFRLVIFAMDWGLEKYMYSDEQFSRTWLNWSKATITESSMEILGEPLMQMVYLFFILYKWKKNINFYGIRHEIQAEIHILASPN